MPIATRPLYQSTNGDRWLLVRDDAGRLFVRHEANAPSGGSVTDFGFSEFIARGGLGPEKQELLRLIGSLADYRISDEIVPPGRTDPERADGLPATGVWA